MEPNKMLNEQETAEFLNCSVAALRRWRQEGRGPSYFRVGRLIRYGNADIEAFLESQRVETATQGGAA
jgi:predicted DNA-binding transcriptional regulator AlpA